MWAPLGTRATSVPSLSCVVKHSKMQSAKVSASTPSASMLRSLSSDCLHMASKVARSLASIGSPTSCFHTTDGSERPSCVSFCRKASPSSCPRK